MIPLSLAFSAVYQSQYSRDARCSLQSASVGKDDEGRLWATILYKNNETSGFQNERTSGSCLSIIIQEDQWLAQGVVYWCSKVLERHRMFLPIIPVDTLPVGYRKRQNMLFFSLLPCRIWSGYSTGLTKKCTIVLRWSHKAIGTMATNSKWQALTVTTQVACMGNHAFKIKRIIPRSSIKQHASPSRHRKNICNQKVRLVVTLIRRSRLAENLTKNDVDLSVLIHACQGIFQML